ncbi:UNVERIFIED_CONTAM: Polygalacturonase 1 beta-like protein 2 [Sesamum calycinum]|uniref:Polygalacturonase 1 beta-like protein 2 n=1 Tax=Sesamum calycinum TaxID=2727403 RepID=A0AAW2NHY3_9LAMI
MKMDSKSVNLNTTILSIFLFLLFSCFTTLCSSDETNATPRTSVSSNPFTPRASVVRYWAKHISNNLPQPSFLLSKASPLSPVESAFFTKLAAEKALSAHLSAFCSAADLFCLHGSKPAVENHKSDANFAFYTNKNFANYGNARLGGLISSRTTPTESTSPPAPSPGTAGAPPATTRASPATLMMVM